MAIEVMVGPTVRRLMRARGEEIAAPSIDRQVVRRAWRIVPPVETMFNQGKISNRLWEAYQRFDGDWVRAALQPNVVARYGRGGSGGTPLRQMTAEAIDRADDKAARRSSSVEAVESALAAVVVPEARAAIVMAVSTDGSLADIGTALSPYRDRGKATAAASQMLISGLWLLDHHYSLLYGQSQTVP